MSEARTNEASSIPENVERAAAVLEENADFVRGVIRFQVRNEAEAEDLFQDLFLFLVSKPISDDIENVRGFLYKVISDMAKSVFQRADRYRARIGRYAERQRHAQEKCPHDSLALAEEASRMFGLIEKRLPPKEAQALTLRYIESHDTSEVAMKMGVEPRSVSRYVSVGLRKVRGFFKEQEVGVYDND
jgi:RNA polymerase sigma factor (sigma-70 family)